jgi:nitrate reductase NapE component
MSLSVLARLGNYIRERRNFLKFSVVSAGLPAAAIALATLGSYGAVVFWIFLVILAPAGAYLWGVVFWELFLENIYHRE